MDKKTPPSENKLTIAFIVVQFPKLSETFILNQITGLIDMGCEIDIFPLNKTRSSKFHEAIYKYNLLSRTFYRNRPNNWLWRIMKAIVLFWAMMYKDPTVLIKSLNFFKYGKMSLSLSLFYSALCVLDRGPYHIIHAHFGYAGNMAVALRDIGATNAKIVTSFHGFDITSYVKKHGIDIYSRLFQKGDLYIVSSNFIRNKVQLLGCDGNKIVKIPVGLKPTDFSFNEKQLKQNDTVKIITVARLVEVKGIEYGIRAVAKVTKFYPNIAYYIVGDGPLRDNLHAIIKELDDKNKLSILGWMTQEEIKRLYDACHIFILPSIEASTGEQEGQGLVLQEAQAKGLPVIATYSGGIPEGVLDGKTGFLVPERDIDALAERLKYLIERPEIWPEIGRAGRKFVEQYFNINNLNYRLMKLYKELIREAF